MTQQETAKIVANLVQKAFDIQYPQIFNICTEMDKEKHDKCPAGYDIYLVYIAAISDYRQMYKWVTYDLTDYYKNHDEERERLIMDIQNTEDILKFLILNFRIGTL